MIEQRTEAWHNARAGKATASRIADIMARTKSGPAASRKNYMAELAIERLTGVHEEGFKSADMQWGIIHEGSARDEYCMSRGVLVNECGFFDHPSIPMTGASPDGLIGDDGLIEIKCPRSATHIEFLLTGEIDSRYKYQMLWQMACTGRQWCDFVSYDPRMPEKLRMKVVRFERDDEEIARIEDEVDAFLRELDAQVGALKKQLEA